ncbi:MAG: glycosyltransferase family 2 protein [Sphingobium sp.]|uniref:glycosyltransferase family 2 protein n=1 Tax=Sphingobium sp. TaxID=1912891 RepID=UPI002E1EA8B2
MTVIELSIVIPCFNEEENVRAICDAVTAQAEQHSTSHEIILIDNHSTDATPAIMRDICARDPRIRAILNNRNYGQMRSPTYGIYQAEGAAVIGMCADFQDPPEMIGEFMRLWRGGAEVVLAQRRSERASPLLRLARHCGYRLMARYGDVPLVSGATGFGLFDRKVVDMLASWNEPEPFFRSMVIESGYRLAVVPVDRPPRAAGESKNDLTALYSFALSGLAASTRSLLRMPVLLSLWMALLTAILILAAATSAVVGGPTLAIGLTGAVSGMFSILLFFLGIIGTQIALVSDRLRNVPLVIERERLNFPESRAAPASRTLVHPKS